MYLWVQYEYTIFSVHQSFTYGRPAEGRKRPSPTVHLLHRTRFIGYAGHVGTWTLVIGVNPKRTVSTYTSHCKILRLCLTFHVYRFCTEEVSSSRRKQDVVVVVVGTAATCVSMSGKLQDPFYGLSVVEVVLTLISLIYLHFYAKDSSEINVTMAVLMGVQVFRGIMLCCWLISFWHLMGL
jgi:hypothetical protein